jgi:glycosyltransferase involved in cell wall biosynthesis
MKLIVQIPCYNEAKTLPLTVKDIPRDIEGVVSVEILVIDDGSTDKTDEVAAECGAEHVLQLSNNQGLARAFAAGIDRALELGADIIVNTDADNQYFGGDIPKLIKPILEGRADIVIGDREVEKLSHFSPLKKLFQAAGSASVRYVSGTDIPDAASGFRAFSREAAMRLNVVSQFTYTLETIIQAGKKRMAVAHLPVRTNEPLRKSRLFSSTGQYLKSSLATILRVYTMYEPLKVFSYLGIALFGAGFLIGLRFVYYFIAGGSRGHVQSLILAAVLLIVGFQLVMMGIVADLIASNRKLLEDLLYRAKTHVFTGAPEDSAAPPSDPSG